MPAITNGHIAAIKSAVNGFYNLQKASYSGDTHFSYSPSQGQERGDYTEVLRNAVAAVDAARAACPDIADQISIQRQAFLRNGSPGWRPTLTVYRTGRNDNAGMVPTIPGARATASAPPADMTAMVNMMAQMTQMLRAVGLNASAPTQAQPVAEQSDSVTLPPPAPEEQAYG